MKNNYQKEFYIYGKENTFYIPDYDLIKDKSILVH